MDPGQLIEKFRAVGLERLEAINLAMISLERAEKDPQAIQDLLREVHTLKGEAKMMGFADVNLVAHQTESLLIDAQTRHHWQMPQTLADCIFEGLDIVRLLLTKSSRGPESPVDLSRFIQRVQSCLSAQGPEETLDSESEASLPKAPAPAGGLGLDTKRSIRVRFEKLERLVDQLGELRMTSQRIQFQLEQMAQAEEQLGQWIRANEAIIPNKLSSRLQEIGHRVGASMWSATTEAERIRDRAIALDESIRGLRHISLEQVIGHYPRAVRDLARSMQKQVRFVPELGRVEVDRVILDRLSEPLLHLVRNAVDHGIEPPQERLNKGKPAEGTITLVAREEGNRLILELCDDGRGMDPERLLRLAIERGMLEPAEAAQFDQRQALDLIFEPGFTTRSQVSDVSGRGLGMDIVLRQLTHLGGSVSFDSVPDHGTTFCMTIPLSSTVTQILEVVIDGRHYAIAAGQIERVIRQRVRGILTLHGNLCVRHEGRFIPLMDWRAALHGASGELPNEGEIDLVLMQRGTRHVAVWVDRVIGEREGMIKNLGAFLEGLKLCRGLVTTHTDDMLGLLDTMELTKQGESNLHALTNQNYPLRRGGQSAPPKQGATVLVVEDSEVTRMLVTGPLRANGMTVHEATHGVEALRLLQTHRVDLVLTDIQMPQMGGLELIERIRARGPHRDVPIVVLSTLGTPEDRTRAIEKGANAYLVKLDFRERDLVDTVHRMLGKP